MRIYEGLTVELEQLAEAEALLEENVEYAVGADAVPVWVDAYEI